MSTPVENSEGLIVSIYARGLLDYLRSRGIDPAQLYPARRIAELTSASGRDEMPLRDWIDMFDTAIDATADPDLPLKAGSSLQLRNLGVLGHVLMNCLTVEEVIRQLARYIRLLGQIGEPRLEIAGNRADVFWVWPYDSPPPHMLAQFMQAARAMFMRWFANDPEMCFDAWFVFDPPANTDTYRKIFGGRLRFGQRVTKLSFSASYLQYPVVSADEELRGVVEAQAQAVLRQMSDEAPLIREVKAVLTRGLTSGRVSLADTADALHISPRTLQRRLIKCERSFQQLLDEVRLARARSYLKDPSSSLAEVAFLLGYTEQSTFQNAFKRWTGLSPGRFRQQYLQQ